MLNLKPRFETEPKYQHGQVNKRAVLYCNLGTPEAASASALRSFLSQFLGDPRVVEIPRWLWMIILHGIILRIRPAKSAAKYASIWTSEGSPLKVWTQAQALALEAALAKSASLSDADVPPPIVLHAMRYGQPSIESQLSELKALGVTHVLVLPAYPQYSGTTTASLFDSIFTWGQKTRYLPEFRFVNHYHDHPLYIEALAAQVQAQWLSKGRAEKLVMSFHGIPERSLTLGDPYFCECHKTARLLAERLGIQKSEYLITFQSRFGKAKWLQPYTEPSVQALAKAGIKSIDIICPGFTSDCLETLEEIAMEVRDTFLHNGGEVYNYIACLNDSPKWIHALCEMVQEHSYNWPNSGPRTAAEREQSAQNARALQAEQIGGA